MSATTMLATLRTEAPLYPRGSRLGLDVTASAPRGAFVERVITLFVRASSGSFAERVITLFVRASSGSFAERVITLFVRPCVNMGRADVPLEHCNNDLGEEGACRGSVRTIDCSRANTGRADGPPLGLAPEALR
jgi:hypothetical protein